MEAFEETLASVLTFQPDGAEILIANEIPYHDPWNVQREGVRLVSETRYGSFAGLLNTAIASTQNPIIHILYPGTDVCADWSRTSLELFDDPSMAIVVPTVFDRLKSKRIFAMGVMFGSGGTLRTIRRSQSMQIRHGIVAPHLSAAYFRKSALEQIGGFRDSLMPQIAYVDATLFLHETGWKSVVDLQGKITVRPNILPSPSPYEWAKQLELLYFRWMGRQTSLGAVGSHWGAIAVDFWRHFPRLKAFQLLLGRVVGLASINERRKLERQLQTVNVDETATEIHCLKPKLRVKVA